MENQVNNNQEIKQEKKKLSTENIIGIVLIAVFLPIIIFNMVIVIKGWINPNNVPTFMGVAPLIVGSDSMTIHKDAENGGAFNKGDIIIIKNVKPEKLEVKDIITYVYQGDIITHRIVDIYNIEEKYQAAKTAYETAKAEYEALQQSDPGIQEAYDKMKDAEALYTEYYQDVKVAEKYGCETVFVTRGDFSSPADIKIYDHQLQGKYLFRLPLLGKLIEFFQKPLGIIVLIMVPVGGYFAFELIKRANNSKKNDQKIAELEAKLAQQQAQTSEEEKNDVE